MSIVSQTMRIMGVLVYMWVSLGLGGLLYILYYAKCGSIIIIYNDDVASVWLLYYGYHIMDGVIIGVYYGWCIMRGEKCRKIGKNEGFLK